MRRSQVLAKLKRDEPALIVAFHLCDPALFELASLMGFDGIWIDMEHRGHAMETAQNLMRAGRVGTSDMIARPAKGEFMRMSRMLEAGAQGIIYPRCESASEAAEVVKWAKFPPLGQRGIDGGGPDMPYLSMSLSEYVRAANEQTFVVVQIEDPHSLEAVEEIAAVPGVDAIMLGPGDFSSLSGFPGDMNHPKLHEAAARIAAAVRPLGKHWGMPVGSVERAQNAIKLGARFLPAATDVVLIKQALERLQNQYSEIGLHFNNQLQPKSA